MAIVTISQIKHRRGILGSDPMPQLASAELGWATDQQELYIGNGTISEGAPATGNTRILTENSDLVALLSDYTYAGPFAGAAMQTGASPGTPVSRSFADRFDDNVNVRSFGATGDGVTDDLPALERAIFEHTLEQPLNNRYWTTIYIPAGTYRITAPLRLPSHVRLVGDGAGSSVISLDVSDTSVLQIERMTDPNSLSDVFPTDIYVEGIGFTATQAVSHGAVIGDAQDILFVRCAFTGAVLDTTVIGTSNAGVLFNNQTRPTIGVTFHDCVFTKCTYGLASGIPDAINNRQDIRDVRITDSLFTDLYKGITAGREADLLFDAPKEWRILDNIFDKIPTHGVHLFRASKFTTGANHFKDVGNAQVATPTTPVMVFGDFGGGSPITTPIDLSQYENNISIGDTFDRTDAENATQPRIKSNCLRSYIIDMSDIRYGTLQTEPGRLIRLIDSQVAPASTGIVLDSAKYHGAVIDYQLNRGPDQRRYGTLTLGIGDTAHNLTEDYTEVDPVGITFSSSFAAGQATINYTSTTDTNDCILSYSIRHLTCVAATPPVPDLPPAPNITPISPLNNNAPAGQPPVPVPPLVTLTNFDITYQIVNLLPLGQMNSLQISVDGNYDALQWTIINHGLTAGLGTAGAPANVDILSDTTIDPNIRNNSGTAWYIEVELEATDTGPANVDSATMILHLEAF